MTNPSAVVVRRARADDVPEVVDTHLASFEGFFLTTLGSRFLRQFYRGMIDIDSGLLLVATDNNCVVGFVGGAVEQVGFYSRLLKSRFVPFLLAAVVAGVRHPSAVPRLARARRRASGHTDTPHGPCLMTLGVSPQREGEGVGRALVAAFQSEIFAAGGTSLILTTDADDNARTNRFYLEMGYELVRVIETAEGRRLNEYLKTASGPTGDEVGRS